MQYKEMSIKDGQLVEKTSIEIDQSKLTSDCWLVQFKGLSACNECILKDTDECGGGYTLLKMKCIKLLEENKDLYKHGYTIIDYPNQGKFKLLTTGNRDSTCIIDNYSTLKNVINKLKKNNYEL